MIQDLRKQLKIQKIYSGKLKKKNKFKKDQDKNITNNSNNNS